jgi:hypothetical protein
VRSLLALMVLVAPLAGCGLFNGQERPACSPLKLTEIEASYVTEVLEACEGWTLEACPAAPKIEDKYAGMREEWVRCQ